MWAHGPFGRPSTRPNVIPVRKWPARPTRSRPGRVRRQIITKHLTRLHIAFTDPADRESGQGILEYAGIIIVVGTIALAVITVLTPAGAAAATAVGTAVTSFLSGGGGGAG